MTRSIPRLLGYATVGAGVTAAGYVGLVTGACPVDLGIGRRVRPLGPQLVDMAAPREVVFDVIAQPYLGRAPRPALTSGDASQRCRSPLQPGMHQTTNSYLVTVPRHGCVAPSQRTSPYEPDPAARTAPTEPSTTWLVGLVGLTLAWQLVAGVVASATVEGATAVVASGRRRTQTMPGEPGDRPVAAGRVWFSPFGLYLGGGATLPSEHRRGAMGALVARAWAVGRVWHLVDRIDR
jgi:hypothetical protein